VCRGSLDSQWPLHIPVNEEKLLLGGDCCISLSHMDNPPRHLCLPAAHFLLFLGLLVCFLPLFVFVHRFKVDDSYLMGAREVGSIPEELLQGQGWLIFLTVLFLRAGKC
jgi:hypothetical protein